MREMGRQMTWVERGTCRFAWALLWVICKVYFRFKVVGGKNLPKEEPYILSPVHRSYLDTPVGGMVTARRQRFLGKEAMWRNRPLGWFLSLVGGFPVERGTADRAALRACQEVLELGDPLVMFPEGTRRHGPVIKAEEMHAGPAFVALRAGVPIVPMGMAGTDYSMRPGSSMIKPVKVYMVLGEPLYPPTFEGRVPRQAVTDFTEELRQAMQVVFDEAQRLAGRPALPEPEEN